jgi:hypothetical protein
MRLHLQKGCELYRTIFGTIPYLKGCETGRVHERGCSARPRWDYRL